MNSRARSDNAQRASSTFSSHEFDFANFTRSGSGAASLNAQKQQSSGQSSNYTGSAVNASWTQKPAAAPPPPSSGASWSYKPASSTPAASSSTWAWSSSTTTTTNASSWTWQSATAPRSMVGDISGKSWGAMDASSKPVATTTGLIGGLNKGASPDLFGDLLGSATRKSSTAPLNQKTPTPVAKPSAFSNMASMASTLPKGVPLKDIKPTKSSVSDDMGEFVSAPSAPNDGGWGAYEGIGAKSNSASATKTQSSNNGGDLFGDFQGVSSTATPASTKTTTNGNRAANADPFAASGGFFNMSKPSASAQTPLNATGSRSSSSDPFSFINIGKTTSTQPNNTPAAKVSADPFDSFIGKSSGSSTPSKPADPSLDILWSSSKTQADAPSQNMFDDWGADSGFDDSNNTTTTELEGLPAPPPGVSASLAKDKGLEYYKQGQFADAIKWLSWAEVLLEKSGESAQIIEVLTCRSSCLKEVGEYKKAVADCTKIIELDNGNTTVILQRALLYESMEKIKLGIADLKEVLKREPQNRVANNTLARLKKLAD